MRLLVLVALSAACGGGASTSPSTDITPPAGSLVDCPMVADRVVKAVAADKPRTGATNEAVHGMVLGRCRGDAWSDETKRCLHAIKTIREGRACAATMTAEQKTAIEDAAKALRRDSVEPAQPDDQSDWVRHVVEEPATPTR
jgi:hypothetical protein